MTNGNGDIKNNNPITERTMTLNEREFLGRPAKVAIHASPIFGPSYVPEELLPYGFKRYHEVEGDRFDRTKQEILSRLVSLGFRTNQSFVVSSGTDITKSLDSTITIIQSMEEPENLRLWKTNSLKGFTLQDLYQIS
jgi:hypothetical protein